jgi:4-hydroxy-tetrahydrodipicolinate synthase
VELWRRWQHDPAGFQALHGRLLPFISYWMQGVELIVRAEKLILQRRGIIASDYCRSPAYALDSAELAQVEQFLEHFAEYLR